MSINRENSVVWTRERRIGNQTDSKGQPVLSTVAGFPLPRVLCSFQPTGRQARQDGEGVKKQRDALLISETYLDGEEGDYVQYKGVWYVVLEALLMTASPAHVEYSLSKRG